MQHCLQNDQWVTTVWSIKLLLKTAKSRHNCKTNMWMYRVLDSFDISSPPIYNITAMMSVWRIRQKISRTDLCCIVYHSCTMICTHLYEQFLSMLHSGDKVDRVADLSPILLTLSPICRKSTVTAHSTFSLGRHFCQSRTCSTWSTLLKAGYFCRQYVERPFDCR